MTANNPMTSEQLDELMTVAVNMQRDSEKAGDRPTAMFAYAVQVAVLELRKVRDDAAALAAGNAGLAAELSSVEAIHNEAVFITDEHYEQCPPEVQKMIRSLAVMQIPAYQAFLAEVRAQGVDMLAKAQEKIADEELIGGNFDLSLRFRGMSNAATEFAAQLRKGVQS